MSSLVVESLELDACTQQFVIGVVDSKLLVASDLHPSYQPEAASNNDGQLRVLSRTFCGADEFQVLAAIPFVCYSACDSSDCLQYNSSKAVYTLDPSNHFIWAFAYGIHDNEKCPHQWMFRIDAMTGEYIYFKLNQFQTAESGKWQVCTGCRASKLQIVAEDSCVNLIIYDSNVIGWECRGNSLLDLYHHNDTFHLFVITVDLQSSTFDMFCSEHNFPSRTEPLDGPILPLDKCFSEWCWIINDILVVYNISTRQCTAYLPKTRASKSMRKSVTHNFKLVQQREALQLVMEPRFDHFNESKKACFHIYDIHFCKSDKTFSLTKVKQSHALPISLFQMHQRKYIQPSETHLHKGILYKFYANYCLTMFLRMPTLQEAAFVGLQKHWTRKEDGVLFDGISQDQLIQIFDINAIWF